MDSSQEEYDVCFIIWEMQEKLPEDIYQLRVCQTVTQFKFFSFRVANPAPGDLKVLQGQTHLNHML